MRWWGWGEDEHAIALPPAALALLGEELGATLGECRPSRWSWTTVAAARIRRCRTAARSALAAAVGRGRRARRSRRARRARRSARATRTWCGSARATARARRTPWSRPASAAAVAAVLRRVRAGRRGGGRRSAAARAWSAAWSRCAAPHAAAISLDLSRLDRAARRRPGLADRRAWSRASSARSWSAAWAPQGLTLGHFPQSFEFSTVGGWVATRSAGQASTGYGRIDELVEAVRCETPGRRAGHPRRARHRRGPLATGADRGLGGHARRDHRRHPARAPAPEARHYEGWSFRSFAEGTEALRLLEQGGRARPTWRRLSDEEETRLSMALACQRQPGRARGRAYLRAARPRGRLPRLHGLRGHVRTTWRAAAAGPPRCCARPGAVSLGQRPGRAWLRGRFAAPYLRDELLDRGVMVETLETATTWSRLARAVRGGRRRRCGSRWPRAAPRRP